MICPKCGFEQQSGGRCLSCGIFFDKYEDSERKIREAGERRQVVVREEIPDGFFSRKYETLIIALVVVATLSFGGIIIYKKFIAKPPPLKAKTERAVKERPRPRGGGEATAHKRRIDRARRAAKKIGEDHANEVDGIAGDIYDR